jgi:WD40 repeat protein
MIDHPAPAVELALAPDGRMLAVGDVHGNVAVWTLPDGAPYATLSAGDTRIQCLAFGREPRVSYRQRPDTPAWQLAVGDDGGIVTLFDLQNKRIRNIARGSGGDIKALAFRPDGAVLVSVGRGAARLWDVATGRMLLSVRAGNTLPSVVFSPDGRRLAIGRWGAFGDTDGVKLYDLREGQGMQTLLGLQDAARPGFSSDGRWIAALSGDWQVGIWDRADGQLRYIFAVPPGFFSDNAWFAFDATTRRFAFSGGEHATLWDLQTGRLIQTWKLPPGLQDKLAFHGPEQLFLFRSETRDRIPPFTAYHPKDHPRVYRLYNLLGPSPLRAVNEIGDHDWHCFGIDMPADGRFVVADGTGVKDGRRVRTFNAYDGQTGETLWSMPAPPTEVDTRLITLDPTGAILVLDHREKSTSTWLKLPRREWMGDLPIRPPCLAPGGNRWFALGGDRATGKSEWHYHPDGHNGPEIAFAEQGDVGSGFAFGPKGRHVVWGGGNPAVVVCDLVELQRAMAELELGW